MPTTTRSLAVVNSRFMLDIARAVRRRGLLGYFEDLWRTHGDLVRLNLGKTSMFLVIHPDDVGEITAGLGRVYDKGLSYDTTRRLLLGNGLVTSTGALWRRQRRLMAPFFTPRAVEAYTPIISQEGQHFAERWERVAAGGEPVDMLTEMMVLTARITLRSLFSTRAEAELLEIKEAVETMIRFVAGSQFQPFRPPLWVPTAENRAYLRARARVRTYITHLIQQRRALPPEQWPADLLSALMRARDEETGEGMPDDLLHDEAVTLYFAGYETTARTLAFLWYALAGNPEVAARLHAEVDAVPTDTPDVGQLRQLAYTLQAVKETLRLYPSAPMFVRDAMVDNALGDAPVPAGARMMLLPYLTQRHPEFWPDAERFDPERWTREREAAQHTYAFIPFATGQRICLGNHFALFEAVVLASLLARRFAPQLMPGYQPQWWTDGTLTVKNGLPMRIVAR